MRTLFTSYDLPSAQNSEACSSGNSTLRASQTLWRSFAVLPERIVKETVMLYTDPRDVNRAEMKQPNHLPRKMQAEAASEAARGTPL